MKAIIKQLGTALSRKSSPTAHIAMKYWSWRWNSQGNVRYRQWRTLWNYISAQDLEWFINVTGVFVFGILGLIALGTVLFAGATHQLVMFGICAAMVAASLAETRRKEKTMKPEDHKNSYDTRRDHTADL